MKTLLDIVKEPGYRNYVMEKLARISEDPKYHFPMKFPLLYRYTRIAPYSVDDIINNRITATSIGEFNDLFDGAVHRYGSEEEQLTAAKQRWSEIDHHWQAARLPEGVLKEADYITSYKKHFKNEARSGFNLLDYLGTYVCCFSEESSSTLMWAHYADANKGMCITYDFNKWDISVLLKQLLFPVAYSKQPIELVDLLEDRQNKLCQYPVYTAVLCAALNKALVWKYEHEWRMIFVMAANNDHSQRLPLRIHLKPVSICFGYHFLKPFFYWDFKNKSEREVCERNIKNIKHLINYMVEQNISAAIMWPNIGSYDLQPKQIASSRLLKFMDNHFGNDEAESMRYYRTLHDYLDDYVGDSFS